MTFVQARNAIVSELERHLMCPVILAEENQPMPDPPYCYYSVLAPRITNHAFGLVELMETPEGFIRQRSEPVLATMSFTFCSQSRDTPGGYIFGEDEALELAEKAHGFFLLNRDRVRRYCYSEHRRCSKPFRFFSNGYSTPLWFRYSVRLCANR